jgi:hypothetical protein
LRFGVDSALIHGMTFQRAHTRLWRPGPLVRLLRSLSGPAVAAALLAASPAAAFKLKWQPVDKAVLAETKSQIDPEASSEVVFWEVRLTDTETSDHTKGRFETQQYVRIKIYNERGRDLESQVQIPYERGESIDDLIARTIRPDGSVVEVTKDAIFDRVTSKGRDGTEKAKSFAMPDVRPGCVIEYQYSSVRHSEYLSGRWFPGQRRSPIRSLTFILKPLEIDLGGFNMRIRAFNGMFPPPEVREDGSRVIHLSNIPAIREEPDMPPWAQVVPWLYIDYVDSNDPGPDEFWARLGRKYERVADRLMQTGGTVKRTADSLTAGIGETDLRLESLHSFCRTRLRHLEDPAAGVSKDLQEQVSKDATRTAEETLKSGVGNDTDIDVLFAALAKAIGLETRIALVPDRSEIFFQKERKLRGNLDHCVVAVRVGNGWKFYDPAARYMPFGMLSWQEESVPALLLDAQNPTFVDTPLSPPASSCLRRSAHLRLNADGTLQGTVTETRTGHLASDGKTVLDRLSSESRLDRVRRDLLGKWGPVTLDSVSVEGVTDPMAPYSVTYRVSIPGYAAPAGDRLLLQPAVFTRGRPARFTSSRRENWIYFHYPWLEEDDVWIDLPEGFSVEEEASVSPYRAGRTLRHELTIESNARMLHFYRILEYGSDGAILVPPSEYRNLKSLFDTIQQRDDTTVTLRHGSGAPQ